MNIYWLEPMLPDPTAELNDLVLNLVADANSFASSLNPTLRRTIGDLVRSMNCYYSNLIEGHSTELIDIQRAMESNYSADHEKRNLQLEARAHIEVQRLIDHGNMPFPAASRDALLWIHRQFYQHLPDDLLWVKDREGADKIRMQAGELRTRHVRVGDHIAPGPEHLDAMLARFTEAYSGPMVDRMSKLIGLGAAHHRMVWIHPFLDGNGRVSRLMSHAMFKELNVGSELWSVSRGLARNVAAYKALLMRADMDRQGSRDGRGHLSESGLSKFCVFFLDTALDQVRFMRSLIEPGRLLPRIQVWVEEEIRAQRLLPGSWPLLRETILIGEFPRGQASAITGYKDRQARQVMSALVTRRLLISDTEKGPVRLGVPADVVERWFPGLYHPALTTIRLQSTMRPAAFADDGKTSIF
jgi:Fic family protein